ncbi:MAG: hypothetical protein ACK5S0_00130 [bacterium]
MATLISGGHCNSSAFNTPRAEGAVTRILGGHCNGGNWLRMPFMVRPPGFWVVIGTLGPSRQSELRCGHPDFGWSLQQDGGDHARMLGGGHLDFEWSLQQQVRRIAPRDWCGHPDFRWSLQRQHHPRGPIVG